MAQENRYAMCPFYHKDERQRVMCEGIFPGTSIHNVFSSEPKKNVYMKTVCCRDYKKCPIATMLYEKWGYQT